MTTKATTKLNTKCSYVHVSGHVSIQEKESILDGRLIYRHIHAIVLHRLLTVQIGPAVYVEPTIITHIDDRYLIHTHCFKH